MFAGARDMCAANLLTSKNKAQHLALSPKVHLLLVCAMFMNNQDMQVDTVELLPYQVGGVVFGCAND